MYSYYEIQFLLHTEMYATNPPPSIFEKHIFKKAQKNIKEANRLGAKVTKSLEKYQGYEISEDKHFSDLKGLILRLQEILAVREPIPEEPEKLQEYIEDLEERVNEAQNESEKVSNVFFRIDRGNGPEPAISTHMVLGFLKENLRIITNNSPTQKKEDKIFPSKTAISESMALDFGWVDPYMFPSKDVIRDDNGKPILKEHTIRFRGTMGQTVSTIVRSEVLPIGTEFKMIARIRTGSPLLQKKALENILILGRSNGLGQWRGSGKKGGFYFKLKHLKGYKEQIPEGWN